MNLIPPIQYAIELEKKNTTADRQLDPSSPVSGRATQDKQSGGFLTRLKRVNPEQVRYYGRVEGLIRKKAPKPLVYWGFRVPKRLETSRSVAGGVAVFIFDVVSARHQDKSGRWREKNDKK